MTIPNATEIAGPLEDCVFLKDGWLLCFGAQAQARISKRVVNRDIWERVCGVEHAKVKFQRACGIVLDNECLNPLWEIKTGWENVDAVW